MRLQGGNLCHRHCTFSKFIRAKGISFVNKSIYCREMGAAQKKKVQPPRGQHFRLRHYPGQPPIVGNPGLSKSITAMRQFFTHCQHTETDGMFGRMGCQHIQSDGMFVRNVCQYTQIEGIVGRMGCQHVQLEKMVLSFLFIFHTVAVTISILFFQDTTYVN